MVKKALNNVFFSWFWFHGKRDLCFDQSSEASNGERKNQLNNRLPGGGGGSGRKSMALKACRTIYAVANKLEGWKAGEGGPSGQGMQHQSYLLT